MADYKLTASGGLIRASDGAGIPNDPDNRDRAAYEVWVVAGGVPDPCVAPLLPVSVLSQDLMAKFTADDAAKIQTAVATNPQFWLLWSALQAQKDPMEIANARFQAGWSALVAVLGPDRMAAISSALGVKVV